MGTIAKALQKHKAELAGQAKAKTDTESGNMPTTLADQEGAQVSQGKGIGKVSDLHATGPRPEQLTGDAKKSMRAVAHSELVDGTKNLQSVDTTRERLASSLALAEAGHEVIPKPTAARRKVDPSLVSLVDPDGFEADLFRLLRSRILFPQSGQPPRTILVTSALPEEGKSFVSANLAINMARHVDKHVLLVDCDLRKPSIHTKFGFNGVKGLSEYLSERADLPSLLLKSGVEKLTLLPSGAPPQNPSELITSDKMASLIQELKARYHDRYIILDSPPPMMASETSAISKWVDGILLVVRYGATPIDLVEELMTHLDREKIVGAVINKFNEREFRRYSYSKYYGYSYKKYTKNVRCHSD